MTFDEKNSLEIVEKAKVEALNMITNTWKHIKEKDSNKVEGLDTEVKSLQQSLDRHLEIYANNGKEARELKNVVQEVKGQIDTYHGEAKMMADALNQKVDDMIKRVTPIIEFAENATAASRFISWIFAQWKWLAIIVVIGWLAIVGILKAL